ALDAAGDERAARGSAGGDGPRAPPPGRDPSPGGGLRRLAVQAEGPGEFSHRLAELPLGPIPDAAVAELAGAMIPFGLDRQTLGQIVARAEGNPLYVEQLARALLEHGAGKGRTWTLSLTAADLPPALESLLVARIDRLP